MRLSKIDFPSVSARRSGHGKAALAAVAGFTLMAGSAQAQQEWVWGGQIYDDNSAYQMCPAVCSNDGGTWMDGVWHYQDENNAYCGCDKSAGYSGGGDNYSSGGDNYTGGGDNYSGGGDNYTGGGDNYSGGGDNYAAGGGGGGHTAGGGDFAASVLQAHNAVRQLHGVSPLTWSTALAQTAQNYGAQLQQNGCAGGHSNSAMRNGAGENLYSSGSTTTSFGDMGKKAINGWYWCEVGLYDPNNPGFSMQTGHYTQVVWKNTTQVGCAVIQCDANSQQVWPGQPYHVSRVICHYNPSGNYTGQFPANVAHNYNWQSQKPAGIQCN